MVAGIRGLHKGVAWDKVAGGTGAEGQAGRVQVVGAGIRGSSVRDKLWAEKAGERGTGTVAGRFEMCGQWGEQAAGGSR